MCGKLDGFWIDQLAVFSAVKGKDYIALTEIDEGRLLENYTAQEMLELEQGGTTILEKIDIRGQNFQERYTTAKQKLKRHRRNPGNSSYTREEKISLAREFVGQIKSELHVNSAFNIGSIARGDDEPGSDIDVLVLTDNCPGSEQCKMLPYIQSYEKSPLDVFCHTTDELEKLKRENPYVGDTARTMIPLFERSNSRRQS